MQLSEAEWKVMNVVWRHGECSARDVLESVREQTDWAYTTVKTMMSRLVDKGALSVSMRGNTGIFKAEVTRGHARHSALRALMDRAFDGAFGPMVHFLMTDERLNEKERRELRRMIDEAGLEEETT